MTHDAHSDGLSAVARSLSAIAERDHAIEAWCHVDTAAARWTDRDGRRDMRALRGMPFGVKDNIDVLGMPTRVGSRSREAAPPASSDAEIVRRLRVAGAIPIGKTVTTEFAFRDPARTRNPYALDHSPGGSSSGSAAAVAARMVPFALGTQTAGSLCRPAAYCGVASVKPSYGLLPTSGIVPLSPSFDTPGVICRTVQEARELIAVMADMPGIGQGRPPDVPHLAYLPDRFYSESSEDIRAHYRDTIRTLREAGVVATEIDPDIDFGHLIADHRTIMLHEAHVAHGHLLDQHGDRLQPEFRAALECGPALSHRTAAEAFERIASVRDHLWGQLAGYDAILLQPVPEAAPRGLRNTGDQSYLTPWTALNGPMITIPGALNAAGLPLSTMLAGAPGSDAKLLAIAQLVQELTDRTPAPPRL